MASKINSLDFSPLWIQSGDGVPDHLGLKGTIFVDLVNANQYINKDGLTYWDRFLTSTSGGTDTFVTGMTFNNGNYNLRITRNDGVAFTQNLSILATDMVVTGGTYDIHTGIVTFTNNSGGTFQVSGFVSGMTDSFTTGATLSGNVISYGNNLEGPNFYSVDLSSIISDKELIANKQNSMVVDGTGRVYPTVDAVNYQANTISRTLISTGFIDTSDGFTMYVDNASTLGISGSTTGIAFKYLFSTPPFAPSSAVVQLTSRTVPLSGVSVPLNNIVTKFVGYRQSDDSIIFGDNSFIQSPTVCQLGFVTVKNAGGTISFLDSIINFTNQPDIASYNNLETNGFGINAKIFITPISGTLSISNSSGNIIGISVGWGTSNNDKKLISATSPTQFTRQSPLDAQTLTPATFYTTVDPTLYYNGSAMVSPGNNQSATVQRILLVINGTFIVQYGETAYSNLVTAQNNMFNQFFTNIVPDGTFVEIGRLAIQKSCTDLTSPLAQYVPTIGGGGGSSSTSLPWGNITGNIFDQTDLVSVLDTKFNVTGGTISGSVTADIFVKSGGTPNQFLKADGSSDSTTYVSAGTILNINGVTQDLSTNREWRTAQGDTGVLTFVGLSTASTSTINIGAIKAYIVNNETNPLVPTYTYLDYSGQTGVIVPTRLTGSESFVFLTSGGTISFQNTFPTSSERKTKIWLGKVSHPNSNITLVINEPDYLTSPLALTRDFYQKISYINEGVYPYPNGANLNINITGGKIGGNGINFINDRTNPNELSMGPGIVQGFTYRTQTGGTTTSVITINPSVYDNGGVITSVGGGANTSTIQYIFAVPGQGYIIQYGQNTYTTITAAISAISRESFVLWPNLVKNAILIGALAINKSATQLNDLSQAQFFRADIFGGLIGSTAGVGVSTLDSAYHNSITPQIVVTDTLGAVTFQSGRASNASSVFDIRNSSSITTASINGDGLISGTQFKLSTLNTAPTSSGDTGTLGEIRYDSNFMYLCVATNTWKRSPLTSW